MQLVVTIITSLVALAGLAFKFWSEKRKVSSLEGDLKVEKARVAVLAAAAKKQSEANKERGNYVTTLEKAMADHLKECNTPLASWANSLLGSKPKGPGDGSR